MNNVFLIQSTLITTISLQILFTFRFINAFNDSILDISKQMKYVFYGLSIMECLTCCTILVFLTIFLAAKDDIYLPILSTCTTVFFVVYLRHFILFAVNFRKKILKQFVVVICKNKKCVQNDIFNLYQYQILLSINQNGVKNPIIY